MEETQTKPSQATAGLRDNLSCPRPYCNNKHEFFITIIDGLLKKSGNLQILGRFASQSVRLTVSLSGDLSVGLWAKTRILSFTPFLGTPPDNSLMFIYDHARFRPFGFINIFGFGVDHGDLFALSPATIISS